MHCLYFIWERKFYAGTHVKITGHLGNQPKDSKILKVHFFRIFCPSVSPEIFRNLLQLCTTKELSHCTTSLGYVSRSLFQSNTTIDVYRKLTANMCQTCIWSTLDCESYGKLSVGSSSIEKEKYFEWIIIRLYVSVYFQKGTGRNLKCVLTISHRLTVNEEQLKLIPI